MTATDPHAASADIAQGSLDALTSGHGRWGAHQCRPHPVAPRADRRGRRAGERAGAARRPRRRGGCRGRGRGARPERADGPLRGPLHGVPVLVKDNIEAVGLPGTAGSPALLGRTVTSDAPLVARLRQAGAVILGSTNLSEWANFRSPRSVSGWSGVGGLTGNPWALDRSAGGSSAGSGAAVAAGLAPVAIGTETNGSITCPAALNGVVGPQAHGRLGLRAAGRPDQRQPGRSGPARPLRRGCRTRLRGPLRS